jgi:hypothetical protein
MLRIMRRGSVALFWQRKPMDAGEIYFGGGYTTSIIHVHLRWAICHLIFTTVIICKANSVVLMTPASVLYKCCLSYLSCTEGVAWQAIG